MTPAQILLIEDNRADVFLIELALKENGIVHTLTRFTSGAEALRVYSDPAAGDAVVPDVILLDLNTPRSDGFEVLNTFKQFPRFSDVPIAVVTSSQAARDRNRAQSLGARYIEKPAQLDDFIAAVGQAVKEMLLPRD